MGKSTKFGPKVNVSIVNDCVFIDHLSYEVLNERIKLREQIKEMNRQNIVEGTFGTVKQRYEVDKLRTILPDTKEIAVAVVCVFHYKKCD